MSSGKLRGHKMNFVGSEWLYEDTGEPVTGNERGCGHCGKGNTEEGHDGCIGTLDNVMNACCGHGVTDEAYVQYWGGNVVRGEEAIKIINK